MKLRGRKKKDIKISGKYRYLRGDKDMKAVRLAKGKDACGQAPYAFLSGKWKGEIVWVEPYKMTKEIEE